MSTTIAVWTIALLIGFSWWVYAKSQIEINRKRTDALNAVHRLYGPALGWFEAKHAKRISLEERDSELLQLFINSRAAAHNSEIRHHIDRWVSADYDSNRLFAELRYVYANTWLEAYGRETLVEVWEVLQWMWRVSLILILVFTIGTILAWLVISIFHVMSPRHPIVWVEIGVPGGLVAIVVTEIAGRVKKRKLAKEMERIFEETSIRILSTK
ncbi:hypothetical protein [Alicyclobacillus sp. SO9]|uniref:hypothetical protein n=1 Tax=Alicyclobacillus sp. SO9 TaxID=2665646 RepID=UPI0018E6FC15|nr:hypothetical protein [Alicyclobacillus sp. SO9]QQE77308.1 hypothetical protein GI364_15220 [Alicyclobacillus sp. SO9]